MKNAGVGPEPLISSPEHNRAIIDLAEDAIISAASDHRIVLFNQGAERIFGFQADEVLQQPLDVLLPQRLAATHAAHIREFSNSPEAGRRMGERREVLGRRKDGTEFPAEASISKALVEGEWFFTVMLRDVSARKLAEAKIQASLHEKEVLLKEIHHRVKNNLQVVSSLLGLQARLIPDPATRKMFQESQNRIHSMAMLHERLYESENLSEIDCFEYVSELTAHLFRSYGVSATRVKLRMQLEQTRMSMDAAVPCGLILNELVSNALKYAFPDGREGEIRIELRREPGRPGCLSVSDNGVGLPADVTLWSTKSLGLRLVRILAEELGATVEIRSAAETKPGTEIRLTLPAETLERKS